MVKGGVGESAQNIADSFFYLWALTSGICRESVCILLLAFLMSAVLLFSLFFSGSICFKILFNSIVFKNRFFCFTSYIHL